MLKINGKTFSGGRSVSIINNRIIIDGVEITDKDMPKTILEIRVVEGTIEHLDTDASVSCLNVEGDVEARGSVSCDKVRGDVHAGGSVNCDDVGGNVRAGGSVNYG